jgi:hypothetical protein
MRSQDLAGNDSWCLLLQTFCLGWKLLHFHSRADLMLSFHPTAFYLRFTMVSLSSWKEKPGRIRLKLLALVVLGANSGRLKVS